MSVAGVHRLHICCAMRANGTFASLRSAEMRNFLAAECGKATRGNLRNVPHLIFRKLPLDNFPHSTIRILQNTAPLTLNPNILGTLLTPTVIFCEFIKGILAVCGGANNSTTREIECCRI